MTNFGQYAIIDKVTHTLELEPEWTWTVKPVTTMEELAIARFLQSGPITATADGITRNEIRTNIEIAIEEVSLTFGGTTIPGASGKKPALPEDATLNEVRNYVKTMPTELLNEIWAVVGKSNLKWGPMKKKVTEST